MVCTQYTFAPTYTCMQTNASSQLCTHLPKLSDSSLFVHAYHSMYLIIWFDLNYSHNLQTVSQSSFPICVHVL